MKKSSIDGNRYLDYLWELGELPVYIYWWCWRFAAPDSLRSVHSENQGFFKVTKHPHPGNYCWTHGHRVSKDHTSATCGNKAAGHKDDATLSNTMGGSEKDKGWDKPRT